ncbi:probable plastid-lipid-associated protein 4, chloroplastic isoform X2 [Cornus florida]|uniref:probable plastid-lipid-associated protein 4, chloroplastic isoform X2 n=1 Tax=Cornus florida TaxID=4283 RepID=UPI00289D7FF9|nr:probable plastid-lipid-associated protein 4, chloroplastic isoform X2 [Cornus florida]
MALSSCCVTLSNDNINNTFFKSSTHHIFNSHTSATIITSNPLLSFPRKPQSTTTRIEYIPNNKPFEVSGHQRWRTRVSFFPSFLTKGKDSESLKEELFEAIAPLDRGAEATTEDQERVDQIARKLEAMNKTKEPLKSNLLNGKWELLYTTSTSILQTQRPKFFRANGKIYQAINLDTLRAQNMETWPFFNQATANLVPLNARRVAVKFDAFKIAGVDIKRQRGKPVHLKNGRSILQSSSLM